jgi:hypothetical protein
MKLDHNTNLEGRGKYALLRLREWPHGYSPECQDAFDLLVEANAIDFGDTPETEFFVVRLKDKYAAAALRAYADAAQEDDPEYAYEIRMLAEKAEYHPCKRRPD